MHARKLARGTAAAVMAGALSLAAAGVSTADPSGTKQSVAATGTLKAGLLPATGAVVKLYDRETVTDDLLDQVTVDPLTGNFSVSGTDTELTALDAYLKVYSKVGALVCWKTFEISIPAEYVTEGDTPASTYNVGTVDIAATPGQVTDCTGP